MKRFFSWKNAISALALFGLLGIGNLNAQQLPEFELVDTGIPDSAISGSARSDVNNLGIVWFQKSAFFDRDGNIGAFTPNTTYNLNDLVDVPSEWNYLLIHDLADNGTGLVGRVSNDLGGFRGFYCDLADVNPGTGKSEFYLLPDYGFTKSGARGINDDGDIVIQAQRADGSWTLLVTHTTDLNVAVPTGVDVVDSWGFAVNNRIYNSSGDLVRDAQVMIQLPNTFNSAVYTLGTPATSLVDVNNAVGYDVWGWKMNDAGNLASIIRVEIETGRKGKKDQTTTADVASFLEFPFVGSPIFLGGPDTRANDINNQNDVLVTNRFQNPVYLVQDGTSYELDQVTVQGSSSDLDFWNARSGMSAKGMNDRTSAGTAQLLIRVWTETGRGKKTTRENRLFLLDPLND